MHYISSRCSKCNFLIRPYSRANSKDMETFGIPFDVCPSCKSVLRNGHKEYIMMSKLDIFKYYIPSAIFGPVIGLFVGGIVGSLLFQDNRTGFIISLILGALIIEILFLRSCNKNFNEQRDKSIERTRSKRYLDTLLYLNFIDDQQYDDFTDLYDVIDDTDDDTLKKDNKDLSKRKNNNSIDNNEENDNFDIKYKKLQKLKNLYDNDIITKDEFEKEKEKILNN